MVSFSADLHGLGEAGSSDGEQHELLEGELVSSMRTTIDNIECGSRKDVGWLDASELGKVLVEGDILLNSSGLSDSNTDAKDGVSSEFTLVRSTVELDEEVIDVFLGGDLKARLDQLRGNNVVDIGDGLRNTWTGVSGSCLEICIRGCSPFPTYEVLSLSRNSTASWIPVEAPDGTAARKRPKTQPKFQAEQSE